MSAPHGKFLSCALLLLIVSGCGGGKSLVSGRGSENKGEPQVAYEQYLRAANEHPGSPQVSAALERVRPSASAYWESQALLQMDQGHYDEAWQLLMKSLEIEPDSAATAKLIRQIENQHPTEVAAVKLNWQQRGNVSLAAVTRSRSTAPGRATDSGLQRIAMAPAGPPPSASSEAQLAPAAQPMKPETKPAHDDTAQKQIATADDSSRRPVIKPAFQRKSTDERLTAPSREPGRQTVNSSRRDKSAKTSLPARPAVQMSPGGFTYLESLSLKDRTLAKSMSLPDGVEIRLKDTDADLEADFDMYIGKNRVKKIRGMKIGRSQILTGSSGELYRLTLLGIHHPSHTVRVGIKPA